MSLNAELAYGRGEAPKSKWTKAKLIEAYTGAIKVLADFREWMDKDEYIAKLSKYTKAELEKGLSYCGWHHTGKFANETNFYGLDINDAANVLSVPFTIQTSLKEIADLQEEYEDYHGADLW